MIRTTNTRFNDPIPKTKGVIDLNFSYAFQPIVDSQKQEISSFEALIRGPKGESASSILLHPLVKDSVIFDEICRRKILEMAGRLKLRKNLNINLSTHILYQLDMNITATFKSSLKTGFPIENVIFEVTETENLADQRVLLQNLRLLQDFGFKTAIDDFGMGHSGLNLLVKYQPNFIKLDRNLISNIQNDRVKQIVFSGVQQMCEKLSIDIVAEGVERKDEYLWLKKAGIVLFQGYYFAMPAFESLPPIAVNVF